MSLAFRRLVPGDEAAVRGWIEAYLVEHVGWWLAARGLDGEAADALSGARPGARGESLEQYVKRLRELEKIATRHAGVDKVYAMQAGREIRVMVQPGAVDDDAAVVLSHEIAREIEKELEYPGQIKVTVIRESRAVEYAR